MITMKQLTAASCIVILFSSNFICFAQSEKLLQGNNKGEILEPTDFQEVSEFKETGAEYKARMKWWIDARFGQFICWGPVALTGKEIGWNRGGHRRDGYGTGSIPVEIYDNLYRHFNPSLFDEKEWVKTAKEAGTKYIIFLTKHHDGFCLWDTQTTDNKITNPKSPFARDVSREIADACHEAGMKLIWYFSLGDWYNPDYYTENHHRFDEYTLEQIRELCTNYGKIDGFWFDLAYTKMKENNMGEKIRDLIHSLQPGAIINNRGGLSGDYSTPEQRIGTFQTHRLWESCITLGTQWAWKSRDKIKSLQECIYILANTAGGDGNLALNIGPMPDGRIEPRQVERLREVGRWMKKYGESIYGTRGGPFMPGDYGSSTHKGNKIYVHVLNWDSQSISLPPIDKKITNSFLLTGGDVKVAQTSDEIIIKVSRQNQQEIDTIVVLELKTPASDIKPVITSSDTVAFRKKSGACSVYQNNFKHGADKAFDGDFNTSWIGEEKEGKAWLEVDLGQTRRIAQALICESSPGQIKIYELQYINTGNTWKTVYRGIGLGAQAVVRFEPVKARRFRINILEMDGRPTISELKLTGPTVATKEEFKMSGAAVSKELWNASLNNWIKVGASKVYKNLRQYGPDKLLDGKRWIAGNVETAWFDIDYGRSRTVNQAKITTNRYWQDVKELELQYLVSNKWQTFYTNTELNKTSGTVKLKFEPVTLSQIRMKITMDGTDYIEAYRLILTDVDGDK